MAAAVHISAADFVRDVDAVLEQVRQGREVIVEQEDKRPVILTPAPTPGRKASEIIAAMEARGERATYDKDFASDVEEVVAIYNQPWNPPAWD